MRHRITLAAAALLGRAKGRNALPSEAGEALHRRFITGVSIPVKIQNMLAIRL